MRLLGRSDGLRCGWCGWWEVSRESQRSFCADSFPMRLIGLPRRGELSGLKTSFWSYCITVRAIISLNCIMLSLKISYQQKRMEICSQPNAFIHVQGSQEESAHPTPHSPCLCPCEVPPQTLTAISHFQLEEDSLKEETPLCCPSTARPRHRIRKLRRARKCSRRTREDSALLYQHLF